MKRAIVLSGGGSKGAYQIGVWKALKKLHLSYDIVTGTSVGALNGAFMVQKSLHKAEYLWKKLSFKTIFESDLSEDATTKELISEYGKNMIKNKGMKIENLENLLKQSLSTHKFFNSNVDYGLITYNLTTHQTISKQKKELTKENLFDFIIASATCFPAFQQKEIDGEKYIDGGYSDNIPINLAIDMGATEIIAIDLKCIGIKKKIKDNSIPITYITPKNTLAPFLIFDGQEAKKGIQFGYNDTMKQFNRLEGDRFTFKKGELHKSYQTYYKAFLKNVDALLNRSNKNALFPSVLLEEQKWYELLEQVGKNFKLDQTTIYSNRNFHRQLKKQIKNLRLLRAEEIETKLLDQKIQDLLNSRWLILYLYQKMKTCQTKKQKKELTKLAIFLPKDFLKAVYLYTTIGGHHEFISI